MVKKTRSGVWQAKEGFATSHKGEMLMVGAGTLVPHHLPYEVMDGREHLFQDITAARPAPQSVEATPAPTTEADEAPPKSGPGSGRDAWADYAVTKGIEVTDDMTRDDIIEALEA